MPREYVEVALDVAEEHRDMALLSEALNTKSLIVPASRPAEQHALLREALRIAEEHDLTEQLIRAINNLVVHAEVNDRPAEATVLVEQALDGRARPRAPRLLDVVRRRAGHGAFRER